ncbi:MAG: hypothetical protein AAF826_09315 [Pseudomonadota bacterium]
MPMAHDFIADASISVFGACGAAIVLHHLSQFTQTASVARSFRFCLWLLIILMLARVGHWGALGWPFSMATQITAALIPLAALLIAEVLLRRHAPRGLKWLCAGGAGILTLVALITLGDPGQALVVALLAFQILGLASVALFVLTRDRASLGMAENQSIDRIALSFVLILPFLVTDYLRLPLWDVPVRLGGIAVLALSWLSISFQRQGLRRTDILRGFGAVVLTGLILIGLLAAAVPIDGRAGLQGLAVLVAALMLLATWQAAVSLHIEDGHMAAMRAMAEDSGFGPEAGLALLSRATASPDAVLVTEADLADFDLASLGAGFDRKHHCRKDAANTSEEITWLLSSFGATHAIRLMDDPLTLVLLNNPGLSATGGDPGGDHAGLTAVVRMARMISTGHSAS